MDITQQWQYDGAVHPEMLKDEAMIAAKESSITALQSYVPWGNVELSQGQWDFSLYEPLVEQLIKHDLKWTPFLILGPGYSIPKWFADSEQSVRARCLEHGQPVGIQSIWNPHMDKHIEAFIAAVHKHFGDSGVIGSVLLGISGNWGESIFPVAGGFKKDAHMHLGWWCGDKHALQDFRTCMSDEYKDINELNASWGSAYEGFKELELPRPHTGFALWHLAHNLGHKLLWWLPKSIKRLLKSTASNPKCDLQITGPLRQWVDFVRWYMSSMTRYSDFWLRTARKYFKDTPLYLVTGGDSHPMMGADFFAQVKPASAHSAGIRATSLNESYPESFFLSRLVASPSRFYGSYFETEEAGVQRPDGVAMRVFDGVSSGARGMYFKNLIGYGNDTCTGHYDEPGKKTRGAEILNSYSHLLRHKKTSYTEVALLYPNTAICVDPHVLVLLKDFTVTLREFLDFDFADEGMLSDGALKNYKVLIRFTEHYVPPTAGEIISGWMASGGLYISPGANAQQSLESSGKGYALSLPAKSDYASNVAKAIGNPQGTYPWAGIIPPVSDSRGVYVSFDKDRPLLFNSNVMRKSISVSDSDYSLAPHSIEFNSDGGDVK
jgi:hypothetical protein